MPNIWANGHAVQELSSADTDTHTDLTHCSTWTKIRYDAINDNQPLCTECGQY